MRTCWGPWTRSLQPLSLFCVSGQPCWGGVWRLAVLSIFLIFVLKKASHVWMTTGVFLFAMIATGHLAAALLLEPVLQIIANLSGGGE